MLLAALPLALLPSLVHAETDTSCGAQTYREPELFGIGDTMVRDGWVAFDDVDRDISNVRFVDAAGQEFAAPLVFGDETISFYRLFQPAEPLEPGPYELRLTHDQYCFAPREVVFPLQVDGFAEPIEVAPVITSIDVEMYDRRVLDIDMEIDGPPNGRGAVWTLGDADYASDDAPFLYHLRAPGDLGRISLDRIVDENEEVVEVCGRATFYNEAGMPSPTAELCTTDIVHISTDQSGPLGCRAGGRSSPTGTGLAMLGLLGLLGWRRRRRP